MLEWSKTNLLGKPVLVTDNYNTVQKYLPLGVNVYAIRHDDEWQEPVSLEHQVTVNYYGTVITPHKLLEDDLEHLIELEEEDQCAIIGSLDEDHDEFVEFVQGEKDIQDWVDQVELEDKGYYIRFYDEDLHV